MSYSEWYAKYREYQTLAEAMVKDMVFEEWDALVEAGLLLPHHVESWKKKFAITYTIELVEFDSNNVYMRTALYSCGDTDYTDYTIPIIILTNEERRKVYIKEHGKQKVKAQLDEKEKKREEQKQRDLNEARRLLNKWSENE